MTKFARLMLTTTLLGSLALPAMAQSGATSSVPVQPTARVLPGVHHRTTAHSSHLHRVADAVRAPAMMSGSLLARPTGVTSKSVAADGKGVMVESKASAMPAAPAAKPAVAAVSPAAVAPVPAPSSAPHALGTTAANPNLPHVQQ